MSKGKKIDCWYDRKAAAEYIGLGEYWLEKHASTEQGPRYIQHGRKVWYRREDLQAWLDDRQNVQQHGAGGTASLDDLWEISRKRRSVDPNVIDLETRYRQEHGKPLQISERRERCWRRLTATFNAEQRAIYREMQGGHV